MTDITTGRSDGVDLTSGPQSQAGAACGTYDYKEDLATLDGLSDDGLDEMGELSDSPSTHPSLSRPTTPPATRHRSRTCASPPTELFSLAHKAERVLGLTPGTLAHARAALENARDEVRRTSDHPSEYIPFNMTSIAGGQSGIKGRFDRARKAMSIALPSSGGRVASVVVGIGGIEEEEKRERRRRAADGVLYWQKEVARLAETPTPTRKGGKAK